MNIRNLIRTGILRLLYSKTELQELQIDMRSGETRDKLEHALMYGVAHYPHEGAEAITVFPDGDQGFGLVLSVYDRRYRLKLENPGEVALYDDQGQKLHLTREGIEIITSKKLTLTAKETTLTSDKVTIDSPNTLFTGLVEIPEDAIIGGKSFNNHFHKLGSNNTTEPKG